MSDNNREQLGEGVIYKDIVPLRWRDIERDELEFSYLSLQDANEEVLRFITTLDEFHVDNQEEPGSSNGSDLSRIEFKLNLLLDMVTQLVERETALPEAVPITLGSGGVEWLSVIAPRPDALLKLSLYLHHKYPRPFVVIGKVLSVDPVEGRAEITSKYRIRLSYKTMSAPVQSGLEKLIFRQHRRCIAQSRRASKL
ncbi:MAG: PilZ domain-containing protein [Gammaproteobacteria bacterium]|nr:PilZ domain-containing protein [Gammaproteobacteria bacterium]